MGDSTSKLYRRWWSMNTRCNYPSAREYANYGGRGISVCEEWHQDNPKGWLNFKEWMISQGYDKNLPKGTQTIDRIDNEKGYCPDNCRLVSNLEQQANTRRNVYITYMGETHHIAEWSRITGRSQTVIKKRLLKGMTPDEIFNKPVKGTNKKYHFFFNGKEYHSLTQVAKDYAVSMKRLSYLIHKGYSIEQSINMECSMNNK